MAWGSGELMGRKLEAAVLFPQSHLHWLQAQGVIHPVTAVRSWPGWEQQAPCWGPERQPLEITDAVSPSRRDRPLCTSQPHLQGGSQGTAMAGLGLAWGTLKFISLLRHCLGQTWLQSPPLPPDYPPSMSCPSAPRGAESPLPRPLAALAGCRGDCSPVQRTGRAHRATCSPQVLRCLLLAAQGSCPFREPWGSPGQCRYKNLPQSFAGESTGQGETCPC